MNAISYSGCIAVVEVLLLMYRYLLQWRDLFQ